MVVDRDVAGASKDVQRLPEQPVGAARLDPPLTPVPQMAGVLPDAQQRAPKRPARRQPDLLELLRRVRLFTPRCPDEPLGHRLRHRPRQTRIHLQQTGDGRIARAAPPTRTAAPARPARGSTATHRPGADCAATGSASPRSPTDRLPWPPATSFRDPTGNRRTGSSRPCSSASSPARDGRTTTGTDTGSAPRQSRSPEKEESDPQDESQLDPHAQPSPATRPDQAPDPPPPDHPPAPSTYANSARVQPCSIRFNTPIQQGRRRWGSGAACCPDGAFGAHRQVVAAQDAVRAAGVEELVECGEVIGESVAAAAPRMRCRLPRA